MYNCDIERDRQKMFVINDEGAKYCKVIEKKWYRMV